MNPYFGSYSFMTLSHVRGDTGYGGLHMEVVSRSTRNRSILVRGDRIQLILIEWWFRESLIKVWILEMVYNILWIESSLLDRDKIEYDIGFDMVPYPKSYSGCKLIEGLNCMVTFLWRIFLIFPSKFHIFRVGMIHC